MKSKLSIGDSKIFMVAAVLVLGTISMAIPTTTFAQPYYEDPYAKDQKSTSVNIQKIKCINENLNVNGIQVNQVPESGIAAAEAQGDDIGAANGNGLFSGDEINFDKNLVNVCVNVNVNEQTNVGEDGQICEDCFSVLSDQEIEGILQNLNAILDSLFPTNEIELVTIADLCEFLETSTLMSQQQKTETLSVVFESEQIPVEDRNSILQCLEDLGIIT